MHGFLATQIPLNDNGIHSILIWSLVLIALLVAAFGGYSYLKRWMNPPEETNSSIGFSLSDLRALRDQGKMSAEEYEATRAKMVASAKRMTGQLPEALPRKAVRQKPESSKMEDKD